jgi:hypothetical protein
MSVLVSLLLSLLPLLREANCSCIAQHIYTKYLPDEQLPGYVQSVRIGILSARDGRCQKLPACPETPKDCLFSYSVMVMSSQSDSIPELVVEEGQSGSPSWTWEEASRTRDTRVFYYSGTLQTDCGHRGGVRVLVRGSEDEDWIGIGWMMVRCNDCTGPF